MKHCYHKRLTGCIIGITQIAKAAGLLSIAGGTALGIYDAKENPEMAPLAILGIFMGAAGLRGARTPLEEREVNDMAALRAQMTGNSLRSMGPSFQKNDATLQRIGKTCYHRK
ncbi:hypothetical protein EJ08DRAFT_43751 [Tothia fuscella]|uniref:Uncharacterized protein n=1 Tax=Tothia fuscella TaxID=1048955 RepID=A0A9P4NFW5_9PEZI|nr:hypothetical protein EJ08DRAFT_43751 [Tothia fuscella]